MSYNEIKWNRAEWSFSTLAKVDMAKNCYLHKYAKKVLPLAIGKVLPFGLFIFWLWQEKEINIGIDSSKKYLIANPIWRTFCHISVCQSRKIQLSIGPHLYVVQNCNKLNYFLYNCHSLFFLFQSEIMQEVMQKWV